MSVQATSIVKSFNLAKVSLAKVDLQEFIKRNPRETAIADVLAFATGYEVVQNKKDTSKSSLKFTGQFEVTNRLTSEEVVASSAFFPGPAENFIKGLIDGLEGGGARLAFQITVMADKSPDSITGYKFGMKLYTDKATHNDPFKELRGSFPEISKAISKK